MATETVNLLEEAITVAHSAATRDEVLTKFSQLFAHSAAAGEAHIYLYDAARRLFRYHGGGADASNDELLAKSWPAIGRAFASSLPQLEIDGLIVPLGFVRPTVGVVVIQGQIAEAQFGAVTALARLLVGALARFELHASSAEQQREKAGLAAIRDALFTSQTLEDICENAVAAAQQLCGAARGMMFLHNGDGWLRPIERTKPARQQHTAVPIQGSRVGEALERTQPSIFTISTEQWNIPADTGMPATVELLAAPLWLEGRAAGVLTLLGAQHDFSPEHVHVAGIFAEHVALAISRLRRNQLSQLAKARLTRREIEVLHHIAQGRSNQEIGRILNITDRTVSTHLSNILGKLNLSSRTQAALYGLQYGLAPG